MTQQEMADCLGISRNLVSLIEIGQRSLTEDVEARLDAYRRQVAATKGNSQELSVRDPASHYRGSHEAMQSDVREELVALRAQVAELMRTVASQAAAIDRLSRGVCRYPEATPPGPTEAADGAASRVG
jgi:transcriptional regulator with XRE-family HTH domain